MKAAQPSGSTRKVDAKKANHGAKKPVKSAATFKRPPNPAIARQFLEALREGASVAGAARAANKSRSSFYNWRRRYAGFEQEWDDAVEEGTDRLEDEALRRSVLGVEKPIFYGGKMVGQETRHSDTLLMFLLKARRPEKYDPGRSIPNEGKPVSEDASNFQTRITRLLSEQLSKPQSSTSEATKSENKEK